MSLVTIIIPTYNNMEYLEPCLNSIMRHQSTPGLFDIIVVNNGAEGSVPKYENSEITVIDTGRNLGWEGGLNEGLKHAKTPYIVFLNDDTYIPMSSAGWLYQLMQSFADPKVAAVGPSSNCVMGVQNIWVPSPAEFNVEVNMLIGFCMMVRREALDAVGGVDDTMPNHGDDLDLSIRFREAGYKLICNKSVFVYHHGFKTGQREHGSEWNSVQMTERTNQHLIRKHGLKKFMKYMFNPLADKENSRDPGDSEGDICRKYVEGENVLELGCGAGKTVQNSIGVDIIPKGMPIAGLANAVSIADVTADVKEPLPFEDGKFDTIIARHLFEHLIDPIKVLKDWRRVLKPGGKIILAVPNQQLRHTIPLNYQHVHAYTPDSLQTIMELAGWHTVAVEDPKNYISMVGVFTKNGVSK